MEEELGELLEFVQRTFLLPSDASVELLRGRRLESDMATSLLMLSEKSSCTGIGRHEMSCIVLTVTGFVVAGFRSVYFVSCRFLSFLSCASTPRFALASSCSEQSLTVLRIFSRE